MAGQSTSVLDDIIGAFVSVGRTLVAIVLGVLALFAGLILLAVGGAAWLFFWVGYKLRITKIPPKARFQRLQMWLVGKYVQRKLRKSGMMPPGGGNPFAGGGNPFAGGAGGPGGPGQPDMSQFFQGPMAEMFEQMQRDAQRVRQEQASQKARPKRSTSAIPSDQPAPKKQPKPEARVAESADDAADVPEVTAEEVGEYQGSVEELVRRKRN